MVDFVVPTQPVPGQTFRNIPIPNFKPAVYALAIRAPTPPYQLVDGYTFPISPENLNKDFTAMSLHCDVAGTAATVGVQRIIDQYGNSPVTYTMEGTTGFQFHGADGYLTSGVESMIALENLLQKYAILNQLRIAELSPDLYILELYDYYRGEYWEVVPEGPQGIRQTNARPLIFQYRFRLAGVRPLDGPPTALIADSLALAFSVSQAQATQNLNINLIQVATFYSGVTFASAIP